MKKIKILSPFILQKKEVIKEVVLDVNNNENQKLPNYLFLKSFKKFPNENKRLFKTFKTSYNRDIYTTPRYFEPTPDLLADFNKKIAKLRMQNEISSIISDAKNQSLKDVWTKRQNFKAGQDANSSFDATLPRDLDLSLILKNATNFKEFEDLSVLNKKIITGEDGSIKSTDLDWTMSNYKEAAFDDTESHLFELSKSNKSNLFQSPIFAPSNYERSIHRVIETKDEEMEIEDNQSNIDE